MAAASAHGIKRAPPAGNETATCTDSGRFFLVCDVCAGRCAVDAKFCAKCGAKLKQSAFAVMQTKLPTLGRFRVKTVSRAITVAPRRVSPTRSGSPQTRQMASKRPRPVAKKPVKLASLDASVVTDVEMPLTKSTHPPRELHEPIRTDDMEFRLKTWMASTRRLVESVLELKRRLEHPELNALDCASFQSIDCIFSALQLDLDKLEPYFALDRNVQAKCVAMLEKLRSLHTETQKHLQSSVDALATSKAAHPPSRQHPNAQFCEYKDAEISIRGPDGKKMFFKARPRQTRTENSEVLLSVKPTSAMIVPYQHNQRRLRERGDDSSEDDEKPEPPKSCLRITQFIRSRWPNNLLCRVTRLDGRAVLLSVSENDELNQLVVDLYRPLTSAHSTVNVPIEWLAFILPPTVTWYRASEVRRCNAVEAHWSRCFEHVVRCLRWRPHNHDVGMCFPIQFRQARMFSFRSFAIFYGLLTVHLIPSEYSLRIHFLNASTCQRVTLHLPETPLARCLGGDYRERIIGTTTRRAFYAQVCEKLYFEYTSRGFELLFPGVKPKGAIRRHPNEIAISLHRDEQLAKERHELKAAMELCMQQVVVIARRRLEQYHERMKRLKKEKREAAAKKIQTRTRGLIAKKKLRLERDMQRRTSRVQDLAAALIQQQYRKRRDAERRRRARELQWYATCGTRYRICARINGTYMLVLLNLDIIDAPAEVFDCNVRVVHASTTQTAHLRVPHAELQRVVKRDESREPWTRRELVEALVRQHLDVFRSARYNVLVVGLLDDS